MHQPSCTTEDLLAIIEEQPSTKKKSNDPFNEVFANLYVGDRHTAKNLELLKQLGITHVLNAAHGNGLFHYVNTSAKFYEAHGIKFMGVHAINKKKFQMELHFEQTANFIDEAIKNGGKVLVHCMRGVSRSATLALAYLISKQNMTPQQALTTVRTRRKVEPNNGFLQQLCNLYDKIHGGNLSPELRGQTKL